MKQIYAYFGFFVAVFLPMILIAGILLTLGIPDAFAGMIALGWLFFLAYLADQEKRGTKTGQIAGRIAKLLGSEHLP